MPNVSVDDSLLADCYQLAATLRDLDRKEIEAFGIDATDLIVRTFSNGILRKSYFVDGELAAMSGMNIGLGGSLLDDVGHPYLLTAKVAERAPVAFFRCAKEAVHEMLTVKPVLSGEVLSEYRGAVKLLMRLGFHVGEPRPLGINGEEILDVLDGEGLMVRDDLSFDDAARVVDYNPVTGVFVHKMRSPI
jgi:hypothetical protein